MTKQNATNDNRDAWSLGFDARQIEANGGEPPMAPASIERCALHAVGVSGRAEWVKGYAYALELEQLEAQR